MECLITVTDSFSWNLFKVASIMSLQNVGLVSYEPFKKSYRYLTLHIDCEKLLNTKSGRGPLRSEEQFGLTLSCQMGKFEGIQRRVLSLYSEEYPLFSVVLIIPHGIRFAP